MRDQEITKLTVQTLNDDTVEISGEFQATGGSFFCSRTGSGNATVHNFTFTGGQYEMGAGLLRFTVVGEWEMAEVAKVCAIMTRSDDKLIN